MTSLTPVGRLEAQIDARLIWFCAALLGIDVFFIAAYFILLYHESVPNPYNKWNIEYDSSYAERLGHLKILIILSLLVSIPRVWKRPIYLVFILMFAFAFVDDALRIHERGGLSLARRLDLQPFGGLRPRDPGELLVWTLVGVPLLAAAVFAGVRSPKEDRGNGLLLLGALAVLALFAAVIDMAHVVLMGAFRGIDELFTLIEEGGEQFTLSLTCGLMVLIRREVRGREYRRVTPA